MKNLAAAILLAGVAQYAFGGEPFVVGARFTEPTDRYAHGVLGDAIEWGTLEIHLSDETTLRVVLPPERVFEDLEPRLVELDRVPGPEVIVVESHASFGARLSVYGSRGFIASNDWIGRPNRWLAPVGAADIDGDGHIEIAFVDRPHLARAFTVLRFRDRSFEMVARIGPLTNHRIGQDFISGGVRDCGSGPEFVVASADWSTIVGVRWQSEELVARNIRPHLGRASFVDALNCR